MKYLIKKIRNFRHREDGTIMVEVVTIVPVLALFLISMVVYFDAYRLKSVNLKASYTISDMVSRITPTVDGDFIAGLKTTYDFLVDSDFPTSIRVTLVQFDTEDPDNDDDGTHILNWSHGIGVFDDLTDGTLNEITDKIPLMGHGDNLFIVQTRMQYHAPFNVGIPDYDINNFVATRPRFIPPCWESCLN